MLIWLKNQRMVRYRTFQLRYRVVVGGEGFGEDANVYTIILWCVSFWFGMVVLMNFIIADMGSTYERVKERSNVTKMKERVGLLLEAERCISFAAPQLLGHRAFGEYLFICTKATQHDDGTQDSWDSFTGSIKNKLDAVQKGLSEELRQMRDRQEKELNGIKEELNSVQKGLNEGLRQMRDHQEKTQQTTEVALRQMAEMLASVDAQLKALAGSQVPAPVNI